MTTATGAAEAAVEYRHPARWAILAVVCLAELTVVLDNTVLNVAVPSLTRQLHAGTAAVQWMVSAYALAQSGLLLTAGALADRWGRRRMLTAGLVVFGAGSAAAGFAGSAGALIAARVGMGVGGALILTTTLAVALQVFGERERPAVIGVWSAVNALGFASGPLIGGALLQHFRWGAVFLVNLPVVAVALVAVALLVPESRNPVGARPDVPGALLSVTGTTALVFAVVSGPRDGWAAPPVLGAAALAVAALAVFARWERRTATPMLDVRFFRDRRFTGAVAGTVLVTFGMGGALFLLTQDLQFVRGYGPLTAGLRTAPLALTVVALNLTGVCARLIRRVGAPSAIAAGMTLLAAGVALVALSGTDGYALPFAGLVTMGAGCALANPAMAEALMSAIPPERAGVGAGINGTLAELGNGLGVAVLGAVLASRFTALLPPGPSTSFPAALAAAHDAPHRAAVTHAFASGIATSQLIGAVAVFLGGAVAALLLHRADRT
ncbi:transmembrane efflux protein (plasmid) [Streptantibioticus cattleyicolor NRRL 8057 = DSM 46488]|uniref:Transmembrane efflux protein n=1 Tax=Streptantibioticus cattleyicolor (strain ATCC 35852 / DSM 46488 / JCM 4925 / NBRC 14057 / NRRL 8057) TaxID=1003195 RepID=G8XGD5_STREN|nr:MFS transporter [Streptantibioticus cattleyicolor]AEW98694.1 transmembrane efflux protein [Streptantibioticus cattleyicolor NRRL 8057 = DSM 46488]